ncbi:hypothetical protein J11TS1_19690 [Oceanobacillus sp. J11TS1]|nr:hypothetical protein J11TS1_19690 [Oceanobacillus sp. J11TS1]
MQIAMASCLILTMGSIVYPLLYLLGSEKSDGILIAATGIVLVSSFGIEKLLNYLIYEQTLLSVFGNIDTSVLLVAGTLLIGITIFVTSFIFSITIYNRKEF